MTIPAGPADVTGSLAQLHGPALRAYFRRAVGNVSVADDLTQDVFVRVVRAANRFESTGRDRAWIFTIAHHVLVDHLRQHEASASALPVEALETAGGVTHAAERATQDLRVLIQEALLGLDPLDRQVFLTAELAGCSYSEISAAHGLTHAAVRSRVFRARMALRAALNGTSRHT